MTATIITLAERRAAPVTAFEPNLWPDIDCNEIGHWLRAAATYVRDGRIDAKRVPELLDRLSANAFSAQQAMLEIESRMIRAERKLRPKYRNLEGVALVRAIRYGLPDAKPRKAKKRARRG